MNLTLCLSRVRCARREHFSGRPGGPALPVSNRLMAPRYQLPIAHCLRTGGAR
jgi:hypothetical protein